MRDGDLTSFIEGLRREPWLLSDAYVKFQARLIELGVLNNRAAMIDAFLELEPALLNTRTPPAARPFSSHSRMRRLTWFPSCSESGRCRTIWHTRPGSATWCE